MKYEETVNQYIFESLYNLIPSIHAILQTTEIKMKNKKY